MLNIIKPNEQVKIILLNQPQDQNSISNEETKDVETFSKELEKMGLNFYVAWKNKVSQDKKEIEKIEKELVDKKVVIE